MQSSVLAHLLFGLLLSARMTLAIKYRFSIDNIHIDLTRDISEDDLLLAMTSTTDSSTYNNTWSIGSYHKNATIKMTNLTQTVDIKNASSTLSVAFGLWDAPDAVEAAAGQTADKVLEGIAGLAKAIPEVGAPISALIDFVLNIFGNPFNCSGPVAVSNLVYPPGNLTALSQSQKTCQTQNYHVPGAPFCGRWPNYTLTYCLERLKDEPAPANTPGAAKSGAVGSQSHLLPSTVGLAIAVFAAFYGIAL